MNKVATGYNTFEEANTVALAHYQKQAYSDAMVVMDAARTQFPDRRADADYLRACLAMRLDDHGKALQILDDLLVDGIWFSTQLLRESPSFKPLQGLPEFERRVAAHQAVREKDEKANGGLLKVLVPEVAGGTALPLILLLHGNGSTAEREIDLWQPAVERGWLVAAPRSEAAFWAGGGSFWPDHDSAYEQVAMHLTHLRQHYNIDEKRVIFAGFSMGGDVAIAETLKGMLVQALGFIVVGPGGPMIDEPESYSPLIVENQDRMIRCVFLMSDSDPLIQPDQIRTFAEMCLERGFPTHLDVYSDNGHVYPVDFEKRLRKALEFFV